MQEVKPGVFFIQAENRGRYPYSNSLFLQGNINLLVDTGAGPLLNDLPAIPNRVILSHYHRDHVTFNHLFRSAEFAIHESDAEGVESREGFYRLSGLDRVDIEAYWKMVKQTDFSATQIDSYIDEGQVINIGPFNLQVIHLPGHTPGHCGFYIDKYNLVYASDIDLTSFGPWYGNPSSDLDQFRASIVRIIDMEPDILVTGHCKPVSKNIKIKLAEYASVLDQRDQVLIKILKGNPSLLDDLVEKNIVYRKHYGLEVLKFFERVMIGKHLESLIKREILIKTEEGLYEVL